MGERYTKKGETYPNFEKLKKQQHIWKRYKDRMKAWKDRYQFIVDENSVENFFCLDFDDDSKEHPSNFIELTIR